MAFRTNKTPVLQEKTASGSVATFNTALAMPLASCKIALTATQSGSGTPSPDNVRTINGYSNIGVGNISDNTNISYFQGLLNGTYGFVDLGSLEYSMLSVPQGTLFRGVLTSIKRTTGSGILPNIICPIYRTTTQTDRTEESISQPTESGNVDIIDSSYTSVSDFKTAMSGIYLIYELATPTTPSFTSAEFKALCEAFGMNGQSFTIQIGSTVYGGEYDARTGVLTAMPTAPTIDKDSYWVRNASGIFYISTPTGMTDLTMCNMFEVINKGSASGLANYQCRMSANGQFINFSVNSCDTLEDFKTWLGDNVITIWGTFNNPTTIQLPSCQIYTLNGVNNIFADTGDVDLTFNDLDIAKRGSFREVFKLP